MFKKFRLSSVQFYIVILKIKLYDVLMFLKWQPVLDTWYNKCKAMIPNYEECNGGGAMRFGGWFKSVLDSKNKK